MIVVISNSTREAAALADLTSSVRHPACQCTSVRQFEILLGKIPPSVVLTRLRMSDGYSDDVLALLSKSKQLPETAVIVLAGADCSPQQEARQLDLGADCVVKDPLRPEVLCQYVSKFLRASRRLPVPESLPREFPFGGAIVLPDRHSAQLRRKSVHLSPKEVQLARLLSASAGRLITYEVLYSELFGRTFSGESSNLRVLLGKLVTSFGKLRIDLRKMIEVAPKSGYRYSPAGSRKEPR